MEFRTVSADSLFQSTPVNAIAAKVDTLAKLYLEGKPVEISDETIAQFCD